MSGPSVAAPVHVLVDDVGSPHLDGGALHHLGRVRRVRPGDPCTVTDGAGRWRACLFTGAAEPEPVGEVHVIDRPSPEVIVAFALTKGTRPDWTVQKLTELGVDEIVPFHADRSVVRWDEAKATAGVARLRGIARAALEQSHGCFLPRIPDVTAVAELATRGAVRLDLDGETPSLARPVVAVGPEGGWTEAERTVLTDSVRLGPSVLRAETAALTAGALLLAIRSGMVREVD